LYNILRGSLNEMVWLGPPVILVLGSELLIDL
jgi:hypothetical protein